MVDPAELFQAISHPERIKILKILEKQPSSFASLKRQLGIESSGNLDHHLKKLGQLIVVREDGKYGLSDAGKEALLSIDAIELWAGTNRRKIRIASEIPRVALFLGFLEACTGLFAFSFLAIVLAPSGWGLLPPIALLLGGLGAAFGILTQQRPTWKAIFAKSALVFSMCLFLLNPGQWSTIAQSDSMSIYYVVFVAVEAVIVILAVRRQLRDFLGIHEARKIPVPAVLASLLSMFSGVLLIALEIANPITRPMSASSNFANFMSDVTILAGLVVAIGGVLILLKSYILGALMSILCGIYPRPPDGYHAYDFISKAGFPAGADSLAAAFVAVAIGALPIIGGVIALFYVMRKTRF